MSMWTRVQVVELGRAHIDLTSTSPRVHLEFISSSSQVHLDQLLHFDRFFLYHCGKLSPGLATDSTHEPPLLRGCQPWISICGSGRERNGHIRTLVVAKDLI